MDAAHKTHTPARHLLLIALATLMTTPGWSQTPAFSLSTNAVNLNQSVTGTTVTVGSTGDAITFTPSISYTGTGGNGAWLQVIPNSAQTTPAGLGIQLGNLAGMAAGTYTSTVNLTAS